MGYEEEAFPAFTPYAPPLLDMPLEEGAVEELPWPHATGIELPVSDWLGMPDTCLLPTHSNVPIGTSSKQGCTGAIPLCKKTLGFAVLICICQMQTMFTKPLDCLSTEVVHHTLTMNPATAYSA